MLHGGEIAAGGDDRAHDGKQAGGTGNDQFGAYRRLQGIGLQPVGLPLEVAAADQPVDERGEADQHQSHRDTKINQWPQKIYRFVSQHLHGPILAKDTLADQRY
ncbi:hypothetical protein CQ017_08430 [Arthrobacter sp. MYb224]|nr:hypothetical protein CQ017_08430 [Arthrobacter sp. MYb224]